MSSPTDRVAVGAWSELQEAGHRIIRIDDRPVVVFAHDGSVHAVEDRCPHMGFPLSKGTLSDGILTCHWHHARFDLCSGCSFDVFADDAPVYDACIEGGEVFVAVAPVRAPDAAYFLGRLQRGLEQNSGFIMAKSLASLRELGTPWSEIVAAIVAYAESHLANFGTGLTMLTIALNLREHLDERVLYYVVFVSLRAIAANSGNAVPIRPSGPLDGDHETEQLKRWYRRWLQSRHANAAERVLLTALRQDLSDDAFSDIFFSAVCDRVYVDSGHLFDAGNKLLELTEHLGREHRPALFPLLSARAANSRGAEEAAHWHHPVDLITPLLALDAELPACLAAPRREDWQDNGELEATLLGDDAPAIIATLAAALREGAPPTALSRLVAYAAARRLAHFAETNDVADWFGPQHSFITANAVHQALCRGTSPTMVRALFQVAMAVYLDRFLNIPPMPLPSSQQLAGLPTEAAAIQATLLSSLDRKDDSDKAACLVARYLQQGHPLPALTETLAYATVREDLDFHWLQVLEAGVKQYREWPVGEHGQHIMIGVARHLSARCPTARASLKLADIAYRLHRGESVHEG